MKIKVAHYQQMDRVATLKLFAGLSDLDLAEVWQFAKRLDSPARRRKRKIESAVVDFLKGRPNPDFEVLARHLKSQGLYSQATYTKDIARGLERMGRKL